MPFFSVRDLRNIYIAVMVCFGVFSVAALFIRLAFFHPAIREVREAKLSKDIVGGEVLLEKEGSQMLRILLWNFQELPKGKTKDATYDGKCAEQWPKTPAKESINQLKRTLLSEISVNVVVVFPVADASDDLLASMGIANWLVCDRSITGEFLIIVKNDRDRFYKVSHEMRLTEYSVYCQAAVSYFPVPLHIVAFDFRKLPGLWQPLKARREYYEATDKDSLLISDRTRLWQTWLPVKMKNRRTKKSQYRMNDADFVETSWGLFGPVLMGEGNMFEKIDNITKDGLVLMLGNMEVLSHHDLTLLDIVGENCRETEPILRESYSYMVNFAPSRIFEAYGYMDLVHNTIPYGEADGKADYRKFTDTAHHKTHGLAKFRPDVIFYNDRQQESKNAESRMESYRKKKCGVRLASNSEHSPTICQLKLDLYVKPYD